MSNLSKYVAFDFDFTSKIASKIRNKIFTFLAESINFNSLDKVLDVGTTSSQGLGQNFFENLFPDKSKITAFSNQDCKFLEEKYPGLTFQQGDGRKLPFDDNKFDLVFSSAVLEHVGSFENQKKFISELVRVSKKYIFFTTPNRYYPIEFHTVLPLFHWLPKRVHRKILYFFKMDFFAREENLNLLSKKDLEILCNNYNEYSINGISLLGMISNFMVMIKKYK